MPTASTYREVEFKLRVDRDFHLPSLEGVGSGDVSVEAQPTFQMRNVYFDTHDFALFRWRVTLRRREGGPDAGWHLKLPVAGFGGTVRDEVRMPLTDDQHHVPAELTTIVAAFLRDAPIAEVVTLHSQRSPMLFRNSAGRVIAEFVDDTVSIGDGDTKSFAFREIEVEAVPDQDGRLDLAVVNAVVNRVIDAGAVRGSMSKAAAALGAQTSAACDVPEPKRPRRRDPVGEVVRAYFATHVRQLFFADVQFRQDMPDSVHQFRVAARRLRSGLRIFRPFLDRAWADALHEELTWIGRSFGQARDGEVLLLRLAEQCSHLPVADAERAYAEVAHALNEQLHNGVAGAHAQLHTARYTQLLNLLVDAAQNPPLTRRAEVPAGSVLPNIVRHNYKRLSHAVSALTMDSPATQWHAARIIAKRARYAAEAAAPTLGKKTKRLARELSRGTEVLGLHQDAYVFQRKLSDIALSTNGSTGFSLGLLSQLELAAQVRCRSEFLDARWPDISRTAKPTW
ncbi:MAG: CYTH and CHAD domain-containing protein [Candidatus Nanopelagicales bacterium]|nr:CYTH and CHAD domain-containing protein [Candidatus Nanopelagicales bacterium]MDP4888399.1 CYTH and CHAD domain-containing protein [Candidatus Nanopelagicales bacterium]